MYFFHDLKAFYLPAKFVYAEQLKQGMFPFLTRLNCAGFPLHAEGQTGMFYPVNLVLFGLLPFQAAVVLAIMFHYFWAALGTFLLARLYKISGFGALLAALTFTFSGFMVTHLFHLSILMASSWTPWLFFWCERGYRGLSGHRDWLYFAGSLGCLVLIGHPQIVLIVLTGVAMQMLARIFSRRSAPLKAKQSVMLIGAVLIGCGLGLVQLLPSLELVPHTTRAQQASLSFLVKGSFPPHHFLTFIFPHLFGISSLPVRHIYENLAGVTAPYPWGFSGLPLREAHVYLGLLPLFMFFVLVCSRSGRKAVPSEWSLVLCGSVLLMLGRFSPLFLLAKLMPAIVPFRLPVRFVLLATLVLALMTGLGWDRINLWRTTTRRSAGLIILIISAVFALFSVSMHFVASETVEHWGPYLQRHYNVSEYGPLENSYLDQIASTEFGRSDRAQKVIKGIITATSLASPVLFLPLIFMTALGIMFMLWATRFSIMKSSRLLFLLLMIVDLWHFSMPFNPIVDSTTFKRVSLTGTYLENRLGQHDRFAVVSKTLNDYHAEMESLYGDGMYISLCHPSYNFFYHCPNLGTPSPLSLVRWDDILTELGLSFRPEEPEERCLRLEKHHALLRMCRVTHLISATPLGLDQWEPVFNWEGATIYRDRTPLPPFLVPDRIMLVGNPDQARRAILAPAFNPLRDMVIEMSPMETYPYSSEWQGPYPAARVLNITSNNDHRFKLDVSCAGSSFLYLPVTHLPGWTVWQDGTKKSLYRANYLFMAVPLDQGLHRLLVSYKPFSIVLGLFFSILTVFFSSLFFFLSRSNKLIGKENDLKIEGSGPRERIDL